MLDRLQAFALRHRDTLLVLWAGLLVQMCVPHGGHLGSDALLYAALMKSVAVSGDWATLSLDGVPYFNKPPLFFWFGAGVFSVAGAGMFAARLVGAIPGLALMLLLHRHVRRASGERPALLVVIVLCTTRAFGRNLGVPRLEAPLALSMLAAVLCAEEGARDRRLLPWFWAAVGAGVLVKGPGGLWPVGIVAATSVLRRTWFPWNSGRFWLGFPALPALVALWIVPNHLRHGDAFWKGYFVDDLAATAEGTIFDVDPLREYGMTLFRDWLPWFPLAIHGLWLAAGRLRRGDRDAAWPLAWVAVVVASLFAIRTAYPRYLFPLIPAAAVLAAESLRTLAPRVQEWRVHRGLFAFCAVATAFFLFGPLDLHAGRTPPMVAFEPVLRTTKATDPVLVLADAVPVRLRADAVFHTGLTLRAITPDDAKARLVAGAGRLVVVSPRAERRLPEGLACRKLVAGHVDDLVELTLGAQDPAAPR